MKTIQTTNSNHNPTPEQWAVWILWGIIALWAMILISSCTTERKAVNYMNNHAFAAAKYCASAFPVRDSVGKPDTTYRPAKNTDYTSQIDGLKKGFNSQLQAFRDAQKNQAHDTSCLRTIRELQSKYESLLYSFDSLHAKYKPCKPDTIRIKIPHFVENTAKTAALTSQLAITANKQKDVENGRRKWRQRALITWAICLVGIGGFTLTKFKIL